MLIIPVWGAYSACIRLLFPTMAMICLSATELQLEKLQLPFQDCQNLHTMIPI